MKNKASIYLINVYKRHISPYKLTKCPYYPSCSDYALDAFSRYSFFKAFFITLWRLLRCNPLSKGGFDYLS